MNCDQCGAPDPQAHLTEIKYGRKTERHLCLACASKDAGVDAGDDIAKVLKSWVTRHQNPNPPDAPQ